MIQTHFAKDKNEEVKRKMDLSVAYFEHIKGRKLLLPNSRYNYLSSTIGNVKLRLGQVFQKLVTQLNYSELGLILFSTSAASTLTVRLPIGLLP